MGGTGGGGLNDVFGVLGSGGGDTGTWQSGRTLAARYEERRSETSKARREKGGTSYLKEPFEAILSIPPRGAVRVKQSQRFFSLSSNVA